MTIFLEKANDLQEKLTEIRRQIHKYPEVGMELPNTTKYVMEQLKILGLEPNEITDSGISVIIEGENPGKTILIRADMDALPMPEETGEEFASKVSGKMHACGHDIHTSMLIGAGALLNEKRDELEGTVKLMFQPGEEIFEGAKAMIEAGVLENPKVDAALDMHVHSNSTLGNLNYSKGSFTTSADNFSILVEGDGGHGSRPESTIDPINVAVQIYTALEALIAREVSPSEYVALSISSINAGNSYNIIPNSAELKGTLRTYNPEVHDYIMPRINKIVETVADTYNVKASLSIDMSTPTIVNDKDMVDQVTEYLKDFGMEFKRNPSMRLPASDDFGNISTAVPSVMFSIGCKPEGIENNFVHNSKVVFDENVLPVGAAVFAHTAFNWLKNN